MAYGTLKSKGKENLTAALNVMSQEATREGSLRLAVQDQPGQLILKNSKNCIENVPAHVAFGICQP
jgi:hypothetical protein